MKTLLATAAPSTTTTASGALQVVSGQQLKLAPGERITMQVHRQGRGIFVLSDGHRSVAVEGLPATITEGTRVVISSGGSRNGATLLRWSIAPVQKEPTTPPASDFGIKTHENQVAIFILGEHPPSKKQAIPSGSNRPAQNKPSTVPNKTSSLLSSLKPGSQLTGKVISHANQRMELELTPTNPVISKAAKYQGVHTSITVPLRLTTAEIPGKQIGQTIAATLQKNSQGAPLLLVSTENRTTAASPFSTILQRMQPGEQAIGLVQQKMDDGRLHITLRGSHITAPPPPNSSARAIKVGDGLIMQLQPSTQSSPPTLEIRQHLPGLLPSLQQKIRQQPAGAPAIAATIQQMRHAPPSSSSPSSSSLYPALEQWLQRAQHNHDHPLTGPRLAALIRDAGQLLEHKLLRLAQQPHFSPSTTIDHDLKALLSKLASPQSAEVLGTSQQPTTPPPLPSTPTTDSHLPPAIHKGTEIAQQGVQRIESNQMHAIISTIHHEPIRVELPMMVFNQLVTVQMAITEQEQQQQHNDEAQKDTSFGILMALNLSHLGEVRIDSNITPDAVFASIHVASGSARSFANQHLHRLVHALQSAGFSQVHVVVANRPPPPEKTQAFQQLISMTPTTSSLLDIEA